MALAEFVTHMLIGGGGTFAVAGGIAWLDNARDKIASKKAAAKEEAEKTDGRSPKEWFDILRDMGREEYERLSRGALDGLEESDKYGKWDTKPLLKGYYDLLMQEWYPEKYCKYCHKQGCNQQCDAYWAGLPPCKVCKRVRISERCPQCSYYDPIGLRTIHTKSERAKPPVQNHIPAPPPRAAITTGISKDKDYMQVTPAGIAIFTKHDITIVDFGYRGANEKGCRITRDKESWIAGIDDIGAFQTRKGLQPTGRVDDETRVALIRYLDAGNPWPVTSERKTLTMSELDRINRDLAKWKNYYEVESRW